MAMATATTAFPIKTCQTIDDLLTSLGGVPADRVRLHPQPGTASERDVIEIHDRENRLCELVDGTLVEKAMGFDESVFAVLLREDQTLDGGDVLPGFALAIRAWFAEAERTKPR
jgi:hypothetical protein